MAMASSGFSGHLTADADADADANADGQTTHPGATHLNEKPLFMCAKKKETRKEKSGQREKGEKTTNEKCLLIAHAYTHTYARI